MDKLLEMTQKFPTRYWNDSCSLSELDYAIARGATGATTNPVIVKNVLDNELDSYREYILGLIADNPSATEDEISWMVIEKMAQDGAKKLLPVFDTAKGTGRISIQTNTKNYRCTEKLIEQTMHFYTLAPNIQVKLPVSAAGIPAIEEVTYRGVSVNATVCFSVPQSIAVAEAISRGLERREKEGLDTSEMNPVCTIMIGRVDDHIRAVVEKENISIDPNALNYAGIACAKKAYKIYKERNYPLRILLAAYRHPLHWADFIGADMIMTIPCSYQKRFNTSDIEVVERMQNEVDPFFIEELLKLPDFVKAYEHMEVEEFDSFGPEVATLNQFLSGYDDLVKIIRKLMVK